MTQLIGYFTIFLGVLWILWPQILRGWAVNKASWTLFWMAFGVLLYPAAKWAGTEWGMKGWVIALAAFFFAGGILRSLLGKAAESIPLIYFRAAGVANIGAGLSLLLFKK